MTWLQRYRVGHYVANLVWILPLLSMAAAIGSVRLLGWAEEAMGWESGFEPSTAQVVLGTGVLRGAKKSKDRDYRKPRDQSGLSFNGERAHILDRWKAGHSFLGEVWRGYPRCAEQLQTFWSA